MNNLKKLKNFKNHLLIVIGILVLATAYFGVYNKITAKTEALNEEILIKEERLEFLSDYVDNVPEYEELSKAFQESTERLLAMYPQEVRTEDLIEYVIFLEDDLGMNVNSASFQEPELVAQVQITRNDGEKGETMPMAAFRTGITVDGSLDYDKFKDFVNYVYETAEITALENISLSYNPETGGLSSTANISKYFVNSEDYKFIPTEFPNVATGIDNPFE